MEGRKLEGTNDILTFSLAGNATLTLVSGASGVRFTYRIKKANLDDPQSPWFVALLSGPDNESHYSYLGCLWAQKEGGVRFVHGKKSKIGKEAPSVKGIAWLFAQLQGGSKLNQAEVWHEGKCGRCGRKLTVPESIEKGLGPDCSAMMGL